MPTTDVTAILNDFDGGDRRAGDVLLGAVYDELHALAERRLRGEQRGHTLQPTALVHEAYLKLVDQSRVHWQGRTHFKAVAAQAMQRVLVDHARHKKRQKRGGGWRQVTLHDAYALRRDHQVDALALTEAMEAMRALDERQAKVVELRLFGGLTVAETAGLLGVATRTVERDWKMGQAWLRRELSKGDE
jgi:RNA polymerase sigma factor (TIGR02999 family)